MENKIVCNCKQVSVADIEKALHTHTSLGDVDREFEEVQKLTHCSTGCGGCHDKTDGSVHLITGNHFQFYRILCPIITHCR